MTDREIRNAKITGTMLGYEDHGILTCMVSLDYGGSAQGFGGYGLDTPEKKGGKPYTRRGTAYGMEFIRQILETVGAQTWEGLIGKFVRVEAEFTKIHRIGNILEDKWFCPETDMTAFLEKKAEVVA